MDVFDSIIYCKGGGVLFMFENYFGEDGFWDGMCLYMWWYEDGVVDVNDFMILLLDGVKDLDVVESFIFFIM